MWLAFRRLATISVIVFLGIGIALFVARFLGFQQTFTPYDHPLLKQSFFEIAPPINPSSKITYLTAAHDGKNWNDNQGAPFRQSLEAHKKNPVAINVKIKDVYHLDELGRQINDTIEPEKVIVMSPYAKTARRLREIQPRWLFTAAPAQLVQARVYSSLFIESVAPLKADLYLLPNKWIQWDPSYERLVKELRRRHKKLILKVDENSQWENTWLLPYIDGTLLTRPSIP